MTLIEVVVMLAVIIVLAAIVLPGLHGARERSWRIHCTLYLKQIGVASRTWALDNTNLYPAAVSTSLGGAQQPVASGEVFRWFQVMSNELVTPWILVCPADNRVRATGFGPGFSNTNLSYFAGLDALDTMPQMFLAGDRNLTNATPPTNAILVLATNSLVGWTHTMHRLQGNIALADGSVQQFSTSWLRAGLASSGATNRLAMP